MSDSSSVNYRFFEYVFKINAENLSISSSFNDYIDLDEDEKIDFRVDIFRSHKFFLTDIDSRKFPITGGYLSYNGNIIKVGTQTSEFLIEKTGDNFSVYLPENYGLKKVPQILLEIVFLTGLRDKGLIPLHASAAELKKKILFLGKTGSGKSTLAYSICQVGGKALADDKVFILNQDDKTFVRSNNRKIYLWDDKNPDVTEKTVFESDSHEIIDETFIPELLIFPEFSFEEHPVIETVNPAETVMRLMPLTLPPMTKEDIVPIYSLARRCKAFVLFMPKNKDKLNEVIEILENIN